MRGLKAELAWWGSAVLGLWRRHQFTEARLAGAYLSPDSLGYWLGRTRRDAWWRGEAEHDR